MKTLEELNALGTALHTQLEAGLSQDEDLLERPYPMVQMLQQRHNGKLGLINHDFAELCDAYVGVRAQQWIQDYLGVHAQLEAQACNSALNRFEAGGSTRVWSAADRVTPEVEIPDPELDALTGAQDFKLPPRLTKALVLETQSRSFLILLNQQFRRWTLHIREFWPDIRERLSSGGYLGDLTGAKDRSDLTLLDVITLSGAASQYGDDLPGVPYPVRPHLSTFLSGSLMPGERDAGMGLRFGDNRDKGYILSLDSGGDHPNVSHVLHNNIGDIDCVASYMSCVIESMREEEAERAESATLLSERP